MAKIHDKKTRCNKSAVKIIRPLPVGITEPVDIPAVMVAKVVGCSEVYVKKIRSGERSANTDLAKKVIDADFRLYEGTTQLLEEVRKTVNF